MRTLVWALGLMPTTAAAQFAFPRLAGWLLPVSMYLAYSAGVIAHNHNHSPTFALRRANAVFSMWISFFYGYPVFAWIPTHNENHHKFVNGPGDATRTLRMARKNGLVAAVSFPFISAAAQAPPAARFLARTRRDNPCAYATYVAQYVVVFGGHAAACGLAIALYGAVRGAYVYTSALGLPAAAALWGLMFTNYVQHVDCDPSSRWQRSRDFVSSWMNFFVFDNGFHTVHHERAGLHWSQTRQAHARIAHLLHPRLQERSIFGYAFRAYVLKGGRPIGVRRWRQGDDAARASEPRRRSVGALTGRRRGRVLSRHLNETTARGLAWAPRVPTSRPSRHAARAPARLRRP